MTGGFVESGYVFAGDTTLTVVDPTKSWWARAEDLNTLLLLGGLHAEERARYLARFLQMWALIQGYLVDHERSGWYTGTIDRQPELRLADKATIWKGPYHNARRPDERGPPSPQRRGGRLAQDAGALECGAGGGAL